jgi:hypothetical protein
MELQVTIRGYYTLITSKKSARSHDISQCKSENVVSTGHQAANRILIFHPPSRLFKLHYDQSMTNSGDRSRYQSLTKLLFLSFCLQLQHHDNSNSMRGTYKP